MTDGQKAAFVIAQAALLNAEIAILQARGATEEDFDRVLTRYEPVLGYNALVSFFQPEATP